jgi:hypothetical protein
MSKHWPNGSKLEVGFMGGSAEQRSAVRRYAVEWTEYANLRLEFVEAPTASIRVSFDESNGSWSYVGTDGLQVPPGLPTMNLASVDRPTVLHQFGRAIGLHPEHQSPAGGMPWNEAAVIRDFSGPPNYWDEATTRRQVLEKYSVDQINGPEFDPDSIMLLPIPPEWTLNGVGVSPNETFSERDKQLVQRIYPRG